MAGAIYEGDIILDHLATDAPSGSAQGDATQSVGIAYPTTMWPKVGGVYQVPYVITNDGGDANLVPAIAQFNSTFHGADSVGEQNHGDELRKH